MHHPNHPPSLDRLRTCSSHLLLAAVSVLGVNLVSLTATSAEEREEEQKASPPQGSLIIPTIAEMKNPPSPGAYGPSTALLRTTPHPPLGTNYVILTDHRNQTALKSLERLADFRKGSLLAVDSLGTLHQSPAEFKSLQERLKRLQPRYLAIAPRAESYRENMHLAMLKLLVGLDDDPLLDAFPGYLIASDPESLSKLIDRTIHFQPLTAKEIQPASIGTIEDTDARRYRSYQKAKVMQRMFADDGIKSPAIILTTRKSHLERDDFPKLGSGNDSIAMMPTSERETFDKLSPETVEALRGNNLLFMFGHGTVERICGARISAYEDINFEGELVFCGSCMSASPYQGDRVDFQGRQSKRFAFQAIDNGAVMMLGHMGLCGGFPKVYPMSENVLDGLSTGESYQRLMNTLLRGQPLPDYYPEPAPLRPRQPDLANGLLYVLWGDPALTPIVP